MKLLQKLTPVAAGLLLSLSATGVAQAADDMKLPENLSISGFIDMSYYSTDVDGGGSVHESGIDQIELNIGYDFGNKLTASVDIEYQDQTDDLEDNQEVDIEQAFISYAVSDDFSIKAGRFLSYSGWETEEPTGLFQYSGTGYGSYFYGGYQQGVSALYSGDGYALAVSVVNDLGGEGTDTEHPGIETMIALMPTDEITIKGVDDLTESIFTIPADRIEAGTYLIAAALTYGNIVIQDINANRMNNILDKLKLAGAVIETNENSISLSMPHDSIHPVDITTAPFPGFPTDMQAQFTVLNSLSNGSAVVTENVFENRFMHVQELNRMGCDITVKGSNAFVKGVNRLTGAPVMATDLRASASLILAGLCADGETIVDRIYHIDRGYERIEEKLSYLGANITRLPG